MLEECEYLSRVRPVTNDSQPLFIGFKGAGKLDQRNLAILEALLQFRKKMAQKNPWIEDPASSCRVSARCCGSNIKCYEVSVVVQLCGQ